MPHNKNGTSFRPLNATFHCLNEHQLLLAADPVEQIFFGYLMPFLIAFGLIGNLLNLSILIGPGMKTRSNTLLASLALSDMLFLSFMLPHSLAHYSVFSMNNAFRLFYFTTKMHFLAFLNWSSAAAIWLVLSICLERLIGIRYPLSVRKHRRSSTQLLITGVILGTGLLTFYYHFSYDCVIKHFCRDTQVHSYCVAVDSDKWPNNRTNPHSHLLRQYVRWSPHINATLVIFVPTVVIVTANALLIWTLRQRQKFLSISIHNPSIISSNKSVDFRHPSLVRSSVGSNLTTVVSMANKTTSAAPPSVTTMQMRIEQRVTLTVCAIVTCFTITQAPSAVVTLATGFVELKGPTSHLRLRTVIAFMVVLGKSLNFVLFCLSSANFRTRLWNMIKWRLFHKGPTNNAGHKMSSGGYLTMHHMNNNGVHREETVHTYVPH